MHAKLIVAATVTAALLAGCSSPGTVGGSTLPTRTDTGTSTAVSATVFDPAGWQRLPDRPVADTAPLDLDGKAFGPLPRPGMRVRQDLGAGLTYDCTAGPLTRDRDDSHVGLLVVGHCDKRPVAGVFTYADAAETVPVELGHYVNADRFGGALLQLNPGATPDPAATHWGPYRAAGVIPADQVPAALPTGSPICVLTSRGAVRCGETLSVNTGHLSATFIDSGLAPGDSGSLLFAVAKNGDAYAVSLLTDTGAGADPRYNTVTSVYLSPILDRLGVDLMTG